MIRKLLMTLSMAVVLSGCKSDLKSSLIDSVKQACSIGSKPNCMIVLKDITTFKWDKMYIFPDWTTSDIIAKTIGFSYDGNDVEDNYSRMLFTDGAKVVYEEDFKSLVDNNTMIEFQGADDSLSKAKVYYLTSAQAIFTVHKDKSKGNCTDCTVFILTPQMK